jgi:hypothetical protein
MWSRLTYPRKKKKCIIVPLVGRPTMNQSSQVFKGYVCLLSYASVVGHGLLSRHLIAS